MIDDIKKTQWVAADKLRINMISQEEIKDFMKDPTTKKTGRPDKMFSFNHTEEAS